MNINPTLKYGGFSTAYTSAKMLMQVSVATTSPAGT